MRLRPLVLALAIGIPVGIPVAHAQRLDQSSGVRRLALVESPEVAISRLGLHLTSRSAAAVCDGSEVRDVESKKQRGNLMFYGGLATLVLSNFLPKDESKVLLATAVGAGGAVVGYLGYSMRNATINPESVDRAFQTFKVGETKPEDVLLCIGEPSSSTMEGNESAWTYIAAKPGMFGKSSYRNATVAFKNGVVTAVR